MMREPVLCKFKHPFEVIKAHAVLEMALEQGLITDPLDLDRSRTALSVLCWLMDHSEPTSAFDVVLARLKTEIRVELIETSPMPAGVH